MSKPNNISVFLVTVFIEFHIPAANSLKSKRMVVKSLIDRLHNKYNASVAEIAYHDKWQRALIGVSMLGNTRKILERNCTGVERLVREIGEIDLLDITVEWVR